MAGSGGGLAIPVLRAVTDVLFKLTATQALM